MAISYPPIIDGSLGSFYKDPTTSTASITVPFTMNRAVSKSEVKNFKLKIKNINSDTLVLGKDISTILDNWDEKKSTIRFDFTKEQTNKFKVPNYYKVQIAYVDEKGISSPFSDVGIIKYTNKPTVSIQVENNNSYGLTGIYQTEDASEKLYSSYFVVEESGKKRKKFFQSEEVIHNAFNDVDNNKVIEKLNLITKPLKQGKSYFARFYIKTINNIELSSNEIQIYAKENLPINSYFQLIADLNFDNGYIDISLAGSKLSKKYKLARASSKDNFNTWTEILDFEFSNTQLPISLWQDFTVEQGVSYKYAMFMYNDNGFYSEKILSKTVNVDFEDMFLYDGKKQLKIRFNPKVSSFKSTILENKQDTIGGKYPFIFRNGYVNYKEFPISGTISYLGDEIGIFLDKNKYLKNEEVMDLLDSSSNINGDLSDFYNSTNQTRENVYNERQFKMEVLNWLTNGKPKVFRSPVEGNYLVKLMNVSLTPLSDGIGRMIHNFSATAYEIDDYNEKNLLNYKFINNSFKLPDQNLIYRTFRLIENQGRDLIQKIDGKIGYSLSFYINEETEEYTDRKAKINDVEVQLYNNYKILNKKIKSLILYEKYGPTDNVTIGYYPDRNPPQPTDIQTIDTVDIPCFQTCGKGLNQNLLQDFTDIGKYLAYVYNFKVYANQIITIYRKKRVGAKGYDYHILKDPNSDIANIIHNQIYEIYDLDDPKYKLLGYFYRPYKKSKFNKISMSKPNLKCIYLDKNKIEHQININQLPYSTTIEDIPISIAATPGVIIEIGGRSAFINYEVKNSDKTLKDCYDDLAKKEAAFAEKETLKDDPPVNTDPEPVPGQATKPVPKPVIDPVSGEVVKENQVNDDGDLVDDKGTLIEDISNAVLKIVEEVKTGTQELAEAVATARKAIRDRLSELFGWKG